VWDELLLNLFEEPLLIELEEPRLLVFLNPDMKHPAQSVPVPAIEEPILWNVDTPRLAELEDPEDALVPEILEATLTDPVEPRLVDPDPLVKLEDPDVNVDPVAELPDEVDNDPTEEPANITATLASWSAETDDSLSKLEIAFAVPVVPNLTELDEPSVKLEDPELIIELLEETEDESELEPEDSALNTLVVPLLAELEDPELNETNDPLLSVDENPEIKQPAQSGPVPAFVFRVEPVFTAVRTFLFPEFDVVFEAEEAWFAEEKVEPDVNVDPEAALDNEPADDPDKTTATLAS